MLFPCLAVDSAATLLQQNYFFLWGFMRFFRTFKYVIAGSCLLLSACANTGPQTTDETKPTPEVTQQADQLMRLGQRTRDGGDLANAIGFFQRAYSLTPENHNILHALADTIAQTGDHRAVERLYSTALQDNPDNVELLRRHANALIKMDRLAQARIQLEKGLEKAPNDAKLHNSLGVALDLLGHHEQAQSHYRKVDSLVGQNNLALSLALSKKYDEAIALLRPYESDLSLPKRFRLNLALIYGLKGDEKSAARVAGYILDREAVEHNLAIYRDLRNMTDKERTRKVLGTR